MLQTAMAWMRKSPRPTREFPPLRVQSGASRCGSWRATFGETAGLVRCLDSLRVSCSRREGERSPILCISSARRPTFCSFCSSSDAARPHLESGFASIRSRRSSSCSCLAASSHFAGEPEVGWSRRFARALRKRLSASFARIPSFLRATADRPTHDQRGHEFLDSRRDHQRPDRQRELPCQ